MNLNMTEAEALIELLVDTLTDDQRAHVSAALGRSINYRNECADYENAERHRRMLVAFEWWAEMLSY